MGYGYEECFPCYFGGRGSNLQVEESDGDAFRSKFI